ncbi:DMT family transporter [Floridanema aerugineum]|uniref:DMT family transporter n=1 Tax=Floridaenema aerugineum BLCC-F46 TaxID=3153654 RepID=A0ABV4XEA0_9CYAN
MNVKLQSLEHSWSKAAIFIGTASLFFALIPISLAPSLVKLCEQEIGANAVAFHRNWIGTIIFALLSAIETFQKPNSDDRSLEKKPFTKWEWGLLLVMGTTGATYFLLWVWSVTKTSIANVALLSNLNPLFVGLLGYFLLGRRFDQKFFMGMAIALVGAIAFEFNKVQLGSDQIFGDGLALLTAIFIATYLMLVERLRNRFTTANIMLCRCGITTLFILPILPLTEDRLLPYSGMGWFFIIFQALFCQVLGQGLLAYSLSKLSSGVVAVTLLLEPVLASIFAWFIFSEQVSLFGWMTFAVVLFGIYLAQTSQSAESEI